MAKKKADSTQNPIIEEALQRWQLCEEAEREWREKGLEADRFYVGDQWPMNVQQTRKLESRPCLTLNRLPLMVKQVTNDIRMNKPAIKIAPVEDADVEKAKILEGMVRHIQVSSNADVAYIGAATSAVIKGFGYFRIITDYCDDESFDQDILIKPIKNAFTVRFDPLSMEPDNCDARFVFIDKDMDKEEFKKAYPNSEVCDLTFTGDGDPARDWVHEKTVRISEYFTVEEDDDTLYLFSDGETMLKSEYDSIKAQVKPMPVKERPTKRRKVMWRLITATDVLDEKEWPGYYIPVIPVFGEDMEVEGKRHLTGMVYGAMDAQRQYNYMSTAQTEAIALAPKAPFIGAVGQFEGQERFWNNANVQNFPYLQYNPVDVNGQSLPPPQRNHVEPPVQAMVQATAKAADDLKASTGIFDASVGARSNETSGKAIMARQREGDVANFNYIDNLSRAIRFAGIQIVDLIPKIYDAPRVVRIVGEDDTSDVVHINTPLDANGNPVAPDSPEMAVEKTFDMTTGRYDVTVEVGPSFSTKRQESVEAMTQLVQADPTLMQKAGDLIVKNMDFPMAQDLADRIKKTLPPELQDQPKGGKDIPPEVKAQLAQMQQMIGQMTEALNAANDELDQKTREIESKERIAGMNNETQLTIKAMEQHHEASLQLMVAQIESIKMEIQQAMQPEPKTTEATPLTQ